MSATKQLLKTITRWAKKEDALRALILIGSHISKQKTDRFSDLDLNLFMNPSDTVLEDPNWLQAFAPIWNVYCQKEKNEISWQAVYEGGLLVDFTIQPVEDLAAMQTSLPEHYQPGYKILVDKDKLARKLPKSNGQIVAPNQPNAADFSNLYNQFWFQAYHTSKYLGRNDLWRAKHHAWSLKQSLLKMMGWYALSCLGAENFTTYEGKHLQKWIDPETYTDLMTIFGRFYPADSWRALTDTVKLFNRLAKKVAETIPTPYPEQKETFLTAWIQSAQKGEKEGD